MEQTLGKRIAQHRKRLGLTQDALAEKLGITAQAVSKWENDLSCPDIAMLPKLAEIFGISTDELLGLEPQEPVHQAEVIPEVNEKSNTRWTFEWDSGRKHSLTFAICFLLVGVLTLLSRMQAWGVSFWSILWPTVLLVYGFSGCIPHFSFFNFCVGLFGAYALVDNLGVLEPYFPSDWIFPICLVLFGIGYLIKALRKPKKPKFRIAEHGDLNKKTKIECENSEHSFHCDLHFGEANHLVTAQRLDSGYANVSFGELVLDFSEVEEVTDDCHMEANCSFGQITLRIPRRFRVEGKHHSAFGSVNFFGQADPAPDGVIRLEANASFGEITVQYT